MIKPLQQTNPPTKTTKTIVRIYRTFTIYLLLSKYHKTLDDILEVNYHPCRIMKDCGLSIGWGMWGDVVPNFIKEYKNA